MGDKLLSMSEAMEFLTSRGIPCRSRLTFYKILEDFDIPYVDMNPNGINKVRRFSKKVLEDFVDKQGKGM